MANNTNVNKVVYGNDTIIDLTGDTVTPATMLTGTTAHDASGASITGSYAPALEPLTVKSGSMEIIYTPPSGVDGYSQVTVQKMNIDEQEKIVRPSSSMQRITPSSGYDGLSSVAVLGATLQDKTVTPTTYKQTVTKDFSSSYYGLGTVTVEAIPATDITPSNSSPATITSGNIYSAQGSGYAIESYTSVTPSSTQTAVSSGDIVKIGGSGVIVDSVPTPTSITPSNSSPVSLTANTAVKPTASGYAISSYTNRTPSTTNRSYTSLSSGTINRIQTRTGYLYGAIPTGRNLLSYTVKPSRDSTSWTNASLGATAYDASSSSAASVGFMLDEQFGTISSGTVVVNRAISAAYIAGIAWQGRTSSGTAVYSGVRMLKNGTVITGASAYGSSSDTAPQFKRIETSFAVGDVITIQTRVSNTTDSSVRVTINICTD